MSPRAPKPSPAVPGPLAGVRIVELSAIGPAPFCGMLLADMGAELLRIAPPMAREASMPIPDNQDPIWRGRSRLTLDLKKTDDVKKVLAILAYTDILIEGYRPGVLERLGLSPDACHQVNPRLVIGRVTGWGQSGLWAHTVGHDPNYLGLTGALYSMGPGDKPPPLPLNLLGDFSGGSMFLGLGLLAALLHARETGHGQVVDAAMLDGVAALMGPVYALRNAGLWTDVRGQSMMNGGCPFAGTYETADGGYMVVIPLEPSFYKNFLTALGDEAKNLPDRENPRNWPELRKRLTEIFLSRSRKEWEERFEGSEACVSPVLSMAEAPNHPHNLSRGLFKGGENPLPAAAPRFSVTQTDHAPMDIGAPTDVLMRWGMPHAAAELCAGSEAGK